MIEVLDFNGKKYPAFQETGNAAQFVLPYAKYICIGFGYDIGCAKKEWAFPDSIPIDILFDDDYDAFNLPDKKADYIFSSHCLEHLDNWVEALDYWIGKLNKGGNLFLYLPILPPILRLIPQVDRSIAGWTPIRLFHAVDKAAP